jgi:hypothetical protein
MLVRTQTGSPWQMAQAVVLIVTLFFSGFGYDGTNPAVDYTYSLWFKYLQQDTAIWPITFFPPTDNSFTKMFETEFISSTILRWKLREFDGTITNYDLTIDNTTTNWNNVIVTQKDGNTYFYVNGSLQQTATGKQVGLWGNVIKGYNAAARTSNNYWLDEECIYNIGLDSSQVAMIYNNSEWFNHNDSPISDNLVAWWTYGDNPRDKIGDQIPKLSGAGGVELDVGINQSAGAAAEADVDQSFYRLTTNEFVLIKDGPFDSQSTGKVRFHLLSTGSASGANIVANKHYYELQGYGSSITLPMKTKEIYLTGVDSQVTFEIVAELTNIQTRSMYALTGSGIDE